MINCTRLSEIGSGAIAAGKLSYSEPRVGVILEATIVYWGNMWIMENEMEATLVYWGYIGIMENQMEATTMG